MTQPSADTSDDRYRQRVTLSWACFWVMQVSGFLGALLYVAFRLGSANPWDRIILLGTILAVCCLVSAGTVMGTWPVSVRTVVGATIVIGGILAIEMAETFEQQRAFRLENSVFIALFGLGLWSVIQVPFWTARFILAARVVRDRSSTSDSTKRSQYGIRQLMVLTLAVAFVLGAFRWIVPEQTLKDLRTMHVATWIVLIAIASALALVAVTTTLTTLHRTYWIAGMAASAISTAIIAWAIYSISKSLIPFPGEEFLFVGMIAWTYAWLQLSVLLVRAAGYRIVVRT
jgi:hypothetical protein